MLAYKGVSNELTGFSGFQYEIGKVYRLSFNLSEHTKEGFHLTKNIKTARGWAQIYSGDNGRVLECETYESDIKDMDKAGEDIRTRRIKVIREI